jgi:general stress protein YciG
MDPEKVRKIASMGGRASHEQGTGYEWDAAAASAAGRKGGIASHEARRKKALKREPRQAEPAPSDPTPETT